MTQTAASTALGQQTIPRCPSTSTTPKTLHRTLPCSTRCLVCVSRCGWLAEYGYDGCVSASIGAGSETSGARFESISARFESIGCGFKSTVLDPSLSASGSESRDPSILAPNPSLSGPGTSTSLPARCGKSRRQRGSRVLDP